MTKAQAQAAIHWKNGDTIDFLQGEIDVEIRMLGRMESMKVTNHDGSIHSKENQSAWVDYLQDVLKEYKSLLSIINPAVAKDEDEEYCQGCGDILMPKGEFCDYCKAESDTWHNTHMV